MPGPPPRSDEDVAAEIESHIAFEADRLIGEGVLPDEARAAARRHFGNALLVREQFYEAGRRLWFDHLVQDLRHALRNLTRYPLAAGVAIVSLAAGMGGATITLFVRHAVFTSPPPLYADPDHLSMVGMDVPDRAPTPVPAGLFRLWMDDERLARGLAGVRAPRRADVRLDDGMRAVTLRPVSRHLFDLLGVRPALGRAFDAVPGAGEADAVPVVLSDRAWQNVFGGREDVIGHTVLVEATTHVVIGVMPPRFWVLSMDAPLWTPLDPDTLAADEAVSVIARRDAGIAEPELGDRLQRAVTSYANTLPADGRRLVAVVSGIEGTPLGRQIGPMVVVLLGTSVLLTLLIACTNVAMLMIAQWTTREHEIAIRASLGATRGRIVRALVAESALLAASGAALGILVTLALRALLLGGDFAMQFDLSLDPSIFLGTAAIAVAAGVLTGLLPAFYETRGLHVNPLRQLRVSDGARQRWRHALVVFEIAVTVALLVAAGAIVSAADRTMRARPGFDPTTLAAATINNATRVSPAAVLDRVRSMAGVTAAAVASHVPIIAPPPSQPVAIDPAGAIEVPAERVLVGPGFFDALGVAQHAGRPFTIQDDERGQRVAIVNDVLAERLWPGRNPLGAFVWSGGSPRQVVGIVAGYGQLALRSPRPALYLPLAQEPAISRLHVVVRTVGDPIPMVETLRREIQQVAPADAVTTAMSVNQILDIGGREIMATTVPLVPAIGIALLLTAAGIFSVLAFSVSRRANELAVRVAMGAGRADLLRLVALQSARLVGIGAALGVAATFAVTRVAQGSGNIFDSPGWAAFVVPMTIVAVVGVAATWVPLGRALRIDPANLLRAQ
jgi:predicted permease